MREEQDNFEELPPPDDVEGIDEALLADTMAGLVSRDKSTRRFECMQLPTPLLNDLVRRIVTHSKQTEKKLDGTKKAQTK